MRFAYMIRGWIVPQWPCAGCRTEENNNCSVQETGCLRTRETSDTAPVGGWRPGSPLENLWWKVHGQRRIWSLMSLGNDSSQKKKEKKCTCLRREVWPPMEAFPFSALCSIQVPVFLMIPPTFKTGLLHPVCWHMPLSVDTMSLATAGSIL
jgi:hypothetical protein